MNERISLFLTPSNSSLCGIQWIPFSAMQFKMSIFFIQRRFSFTFKIKHNSRWKIDWPQNVRLRSLSDVQFYTISQREREREKHQISFLNTNNRRDRSLFFISPNRKKESCCCECAQSMLKHIHLLDWAKCSVCSMLCNSRHVHVQYTNGSCRFADRFAMFFLLLFFKWIFFRKNNKW